MYPFKDATDGAGDGGVSALHQQVKHHAQQLLLHLHLPQRREEGLGDLERSEVTWEQGRTCASIVLRGVWKLSFGEHVQPQIQRFVATKTNTMFPGLRTQVEVNKY